MRTALRVSALVACLTFVGCGKDFQGLSSSLLGSTGIVSGDQASSILGALGKGAKALEGLTEEQEYYLGRSVSATVLSKYKPYNQPALLQYVNRVGMALAAHSDRPETFGGYHFMILDTAEVNALSAPGGFVFVSRGLLKLMPDEDALASVLAHEIGHIVLAHGVKAISKANMTEALLTLGKEAAASYGNDSVKVLTGTFGNSVNDVVGTLLTKGFSRSQEYDADEYAAKLLEVSGYNQRALLTMLQSLEKGKADSGGWYSTHPKPEKRKSEVESSIKAPAQAPAEMAAAQKLRAARFQAAFKGV